MIEGFCGEPVSFALNTTEKAFVFPSYCHILSVRILRSFVAVLNIGEILAIKPFS